MFIESRLLDCVRYGTQIIPTWSTRSVPLRSGIERRNPNRSRPKYRATLMYSVLRREHFEDVNNAFNACMGRVHSFRVKDWSDYEAVNVLMPVLGTGAPQAVQLAKLYTFGSQTIARPIRKPVTGTVVVTGDGTPLSVSVSAVGVATFTAGSGDILRWSGEFDIPMYFDDDQLPWSADNRDNDGLTMSSDVSLSEDFEI